MKAKQISIENRLTTDWTVEAMEAIKEAASILAAELQVNLDMLKGGKSC